MQSQLNEARKEAELASEGAKSSKAEVEALVAAEVAAAIQEIRAAQRSRDEAMMARLRVANDERDAALSRLRFDEP